MIKAHYEYSVGWLDWQHEPDPPIQQLPFGFPIVDAHTHSDYLVETSSAQVTEFWAEWSIYNAAWCESVCDAMLAFGNRDLIDEEDTDDGHQYMYYIGQDDVS